MLQMFTLLKTYLIKDLLEFHGISIICKSIAHISHESCMNINNVPLNTFTDVVVNLPLYQCCTFVVYNEWESNQLNH